MGTTVEMDRSALEKVLYPVQRPLTGEGLGKLRKDDVLIYVVKSFSHVDSEDIIGHKVSGSTINDSPKQP